MTDYSDNENEAEAAGDGTLPDELPPSDPPPDEPSVEDEPAALSEGGDEARAVPAAQETSSILEPHFIHPDTGAASASQRLRLIPPDGKPPSWWSRHREKLMLAEWIAIVVFTLLALYFLFRWITYDPWNVTVEPGRWRQIVVHHTATAGGSPEGIDRYHRNVNKWENGLGYHFLIGNGNGMPDGQIHTGNRWLQQLNGAHVRMKGTDQGNSFSIGIALVGNFQDTTPTERQMESLRRLLRYLLKEYNIPEGSIVGHGDVSAKHTDCPGRHFVIKDVVGTL